MLLILGLSECLEHTCMLVGHCCQEYGGPKDIPEPSYKSIKVHGLNGMYSACDFGSDTHSYFLANSILQHQ